MVRVLVSGGAKLEGVDRDGKSALFHAKKANKTDVMQVNICR